ncbi:MAG: pentapeptide repeat-containing protein, partial [Proteobacteria bacterium]|nr:pentapeptide repeat-containing protein [Pseudomonadota bacterium]
MMAKIPFLKIIYVVVAVIIASALFVLFIGLYSQLLSSPFDIFSPFDMSKIKSIEANFALAFVGTITGLVALFGGIIAILRSETNEREATTAEQGLITDRINKATEGLGKKDGKDPVIEVRLGALYALERISQDSLRDHVQIMEILCAYIRYNSPLPDKKIEIDQLSKQKPPREDIQAALNIIGRRDRGINGKNRIKKEAAEGYRINLSECNLFSAQLNNANLNGAIFHDTRMERVTIKNTKLIGSEFIFTSMRWIDIRDTDLSDSYIFTSDMSRGSIRDSIFTRAQLEILDLEHTFIKTAKIIAVQSNRSNFSTSTEITQDQLDQMFCGIQVYSCVFEVRFLHFVV